MRRVVWLAVAAAVALSACSHEPVAPCAQDGPATGVPALDVVGALRNAGGEVEYLGERLSITVLSTPERELRVNGELVIWHEYCSPAAAGEDARRFSGDASTFGGTTLTWSASPHVYVLAQVILIYDGDDAELLTLLEAVMGAPLAEAPPVSL